MKPRWVTPSVYASTLTRTESQTGEKANAISLYLKRLYCLQRRTDRQPAGAVLREAFAHARSISTARIACDRALSPRCLGASCGRHPELGQATIDPYMQLV
jgi:hypothetical protein